MLISVRHRFVFVANAKCASTSIERALRPYCEIERGGGAGRKHINMANVLSEYAFLFSAPGLTIDRFFSFGVMRDPIDWAYSWYRYGENRPRLRPKDMSFEETFRTGTRAFFVPRSGKKRLQSAKFTDQSGRPIIDYIIRFNRLAEEFETITSVLGIASELEQLNVSPIQGVASDIGQGLQDALRDFYAEDYALMDQISQINELGRKKLAEIASARVHT